MDINAKQARLVVNAYEWYWKEVWVPGCGYDKHTPHLEKIHTVYKDYQDVLPSFTCNSFAWVVLSLDRPHFFSKYPVNDSTWAHNSRVSFVYNLLVKKPKKKKRRKWWPKDWCRSQKWMKQYEPEKNEKNPEEKEEKEEKELQKELRKNKQAWRIESGKEKDRRKNQKGYGHWVRHPRRFWKKERSKIHRRWVNTILKTENYDMFHSKERIVFIDPWVYD